MQNFQKGSSTHCTITCFTTTTSQNYLAKIFKTTVFLIFVFFEAQQHSKWNYYINIKEKKRNVLSLSLKSRNDINLRKATASKKSTELKNKLLSFLYDATSQSCSVLWHSKTARILHNKLCCIVFETFEIQFEALRNAFKFKLHGIIFTSCHVNQIAWLVGKNLLTIVSLKKGFTLFSYCWRNIFRSTTSTAGALLM